ncbi:probable phage tail protein [Photorhabdus asymbiotica]|uniref:Tail protein X n=2 Tax=Photorhabdus asymbiotica TaxID=291112 RepID=A0ABX9SQ92_9GAMM|nr:tail protein X [Photorhabdus asymbiotica]CAQ86377.1 probable phage tail protein [Photorhabdus asymbiotica]CAR67158.1 probable phage tail protein [Photorhabdus asymbiotica subsp. asymbiotica ATCC 43949]
MWVRAQQYDTVDSLCWRYYGRTQGVTELVLEAIPVWPILGPSCRMVPRLNCLKSLLPLSCPSFNYGIRKWTNNRIYGPIY